MSSYITEPDIVDCDIAIIAEAFAIRDAAMSKALTIKSVESLFDANRAYKAMDALGELIKGVESSRVAAKAPALEIGRRIDGIAKDFVDDCKAEHARIKRVLGEYQVIEAEKKREAEREARRKEQAILDKAAAEQRARIAEETSGRTGTMLEDVAALAETTDKQIAAVRSEAAQKHSAVAGVKVRKTLKFEVKDEAALLAARPDLFSVDDKKVRAAIKLTRNIPGLEIWEEATAY